MAEQVSRQVQTKTISNLTPARGLLQRKCACGNHTVAGDECAECRKNRLQPQATHHTEPETIPPIVHEVLGSPGRPLDPATRAFMEPRFNHDFSQVRVHTDGKAADSARAVNALAYTVGRDVVFGVGQYAPGTSEGQRLLAHELTHVAQQAMIAPPTQVSSTSEPQEQEANRIAERVMRRRAPGGFLPGPLQVQPVHRALRTRSAPRLMRTPDDPARHIHYPTTAEHEQILDILNPQQQTAAQTGGNVPPVSNPNHFRQDLIARMNDYINLLLPDAQVRQSSSVSLGLPVVQALGNVAEREVNHFFGAYLQAAVHTPGERQRRASTRLRDQLHLVSERQSDVDLIACNWVASRMQDRGSDLIENHHVLASVARAKDRCFPPSPASASATAPAQPANERDQALFESVRDDILNARRADIRTIVLFQVSFHGPGGAFIQSQIAPRSGESTQETERRGRWDALGTVIHEMLHEVAHEQFSEAASHLEGTNIAVEGFAEYFTRQVLASLITRAELDAALRASIEGAQASFDRSLVPAQRGYQAYVDRVNEIKNILAANEENLRVAYFMGRLEYLGLGGWNVAEAERREALRHPAYSLGVAALLTADSQGFFRVDYSRVVLGRGGNFQFRLGGTINYLTQGERLGIGGTALLQYSWPNVYVRGGVGVGGSASLTQPFSTSVRLDVIPGVEAGVRIGVVRVGAGANLLIPVAGGPVSERVTRFAGLVGISADF